MGGGCSFRNAVLWVRDMTIKKFCSTLLFSLGAGLLVVSASSLQAAEPGAPEMLDPNTMSGRLAACTACHGAQGKAGPDGYYPRIAGKPAEYLYNQLINFREGRRQYRPMQALLENLSDEYLREIATWFSDQHPPYEPPLVPKATVAALARGKTLATIGDPARNIPACAACHGVDLTGVKPAIPGLLGVPHDYIASQFGAWTNHLRRATAPDCMADIAKRLTPEDISAVAAWLAAQPPGTGMPVDALPAPLPLKCGSQANAAGGM